MTDLQHLSENELHAVIESAEKALRMRQANKRKEVIAQIKELAASVDLVVEIVESEKKSIRKGVKVPVKYRHPSELDKTWTGRGVTPKWLRTLIESGHKLTEYEVK